MEQPKQNKQVEDFKIIGINLLVMVGYTILSKVSDWGAILDSMCLLFHVVFCWGRAFSNKSWMWFLAGLLVLLIGASTCGRYLFN